MGTPQGFVLSRADVEKLRKFVSKFDRLQHYVNAFGREPEDKLDHEEMTTSEFYIARSPSGGIPALMSAGSTGIGDTPGAADCTLFKVGRGTNNTDELFAGLTKTVNNLSAFPIPENKWLVITRDKHGSWYALQAGQPDPSSSGTFQGPGWMAGLSNEDCLQVTVITQSGKCITIPAQTLYLPSSDGVTWTSTDHFVYSGGSGPVVITRPCTESMPQVTIAGKCLTFENAGVDDDGNCYADFKGGTDLCSDVAGTGSGTGGTREDCCGNTFTMRVTCTPCIEVDPDCPILGADAPPIWNITASGFSGSYLDAGRCETDCTELNGTWSMFQLGVELGGPCAWCTTHPFCTEDGAGNVGFCLIYNVDLERWEVTMTADFGEFVTDPLWTLSGPLSLTSPNVFTLANTPDVGCTIPGTITVSLP